MKEGWEIKKLEEVVDFQRGLTYSKKDEVEYSRNVVLRANNINLNTNRLDFAELRYINEDIIIPVNKKVNKDSLIICTASGSKKHLGKVALIDDDYNYAFGGFMGQITPHKIVDAKFLYYLFISDFYKNFIFRLSDGVNINNLKFDDLKELTFKLPPLPEQKRIVRILDKAFAAIDKAIANTQKNLQNTKELFDSYLNNIFSNPGKDWEEKKVGDVSTVIAGQSPKSKYYNNTGKGLPFYQGKKEFTAKYIGEPTTWTTKITKEAEANDILMSVRAPVGPINFSTQNICIGRGLAAIRASELIDKEYLYFFLLKHENEIVGNTGAVFNSINKAQIEAIIIPFPQLEEQKQIVKKLDDLLSESKKLESIYQQKLKDLEELKKSILQKAFEGEL